MQEDLSHQLHNLLRQIVKEEIENYMKSSSDSAIIEYKPACIFGWRKTEEKLNKFHTELLSRGFIACSYETFEAIFLGTPEPINWLSTLRNLVYIFNRLVYIDAINKKENFHLLLAQNFLNKYNQKLNTNTLKTTLSRTISDPPENDLEKIIAICA
ncbi:MAG TPA: hypothetical protein VJY62_09115 [Bacteroidia bacterium]|nr:hypothetical protein [Bacteroidia bacterium]